MKLSKRLNLIASLIKENSKIVDVGCDHALLDVYVAKYKNVSCIAVDNKQSCLETAIQNIEKFNLKSKITPILSNGLEKIDTKSIDTIVISGMGCKNILSILKNCNVEHLIIQSNNNLDELRKEMVKRNYYIFNEKVVNDYKYYVIIEFKKGYSKYKKFELLFGPVLLKENNKEYFQYIYNKLEHIKNNNKNIIVRFKLTYYLKKIKKYC